MLELPTQKGEAATALLQQSTTSSASDHRLVTFPAPTIPDDSMRTQDWHNKAASKGKQQTSSIEEGEAQKKEAEKKGKCGLPQVS